MGDFERTFGAGADAVGIVERYSRQRNTEERRREPDAREAELNEWCASMEARGYTRGPHFDTYERLAVWDRSNTRPHIRRPSYRGHFVYFTDGRPQSIEDEVPF